MPEIETIIVGQGGGPTAVINDTLAGVVYEAQRQGVKRIFGMKNGLEGLMYADAGNIVDLTYVDSDLMREIPGAILRTSREKVRAKDTEKIELILRNLDRYGVNIFSDDHAGAVVSIGGNDTSDSLQAMGRNARAVHGAKTIDNDLPL